MPEVPMQARGLLTATLVALSVCWAIDAYAADNGGTITATDRQQIAKIVPGQSTKADVQSLFGTPWRIVQFNDCGMAMDDQADETWEYRGADPSGGYRLHVEFGDNDVVHLVAKIPDNMPGGKAAEARVAPEAPMKGMSM
jgi:hypothetical protein